MAADSTRVENNVEILAIGKRGCLLKLHFPLSFHCQTAI